MSNSFQVEQEPPEMDTLANLAENLVYRLPGCAEVMIRKTIQEVYRDFCRRSCCLCATRRLDLEPGRREYPAVAVFGGTVDAVVEVTLDRRRLREGRDYNLGGVTGAPVVVLRGYFCVDAPSYSSDPRIPRSVLRITTVETPKLGSEKAPYGFIERYGDAICSGVLARLFAMSGRPWSDPTQAGAENIRYENAVGETRIKYYAGAQNGSGDTGYGFDTGDLLD